MGFFGKKPGVDREAVLTHALKLERQPEHPDVKEELNVMPVEDALMISANTEKRALLLSQLQKDLTANYRIVLAAEQDDDSESAHYVASAKMEIYRIFQQRWLECRREYDRSHENAQQYHAACAILTDVLDSEVLSAREQHAYRRRFCDLVQEWIRFRESEVLAAEYAEYLKCLVELGLYEQAEGIWQEKESWLGSEDTYRTMLKLFYQTGDREKFEGCLKSLCKNRQVHLSHEGLEQLRYWMNRLSGQGKAE